MIVLNSDQMCMQIKDRKFSLPVKVNWEVVEGPATSPDPPASRPCGTFISCGTCCKDYLVTLGHIVL